MTLKTSGFTYTGDNEGITPEKSAKISSESSSGTGPSTASQENAPQQNVPPPPPQATSLQQSPSQPSRPQQPDAQQVNDTSKAESVAPMSTQQGVEQSPQLELKQKLKALGYEKVLEEDGNYYVLSKLDQGEGREGSKSLHEQAFEKAGSAIYYHMVGEGLVKEGEPIKKPNIVAEDAVGSGIEMIVKVEK